MAQEYGEACKDLSKKRVKWFLRLMSAITTDEFVTVAITKYVTNVQLIQNFPKGRSS